MIVRSGRTQQFGYRTNTLATVAVLASKTIVGTYYGTVVGYRFGVVGATQTTQCSANSRFRKSMFVNGCAVGARTRVKIISVTARVGLT